MNTDATPAPPVLNHAHLRRYVANAAQPSIDAFSKVENTTVGSWLRGAGYYTAFIGECDCANKMIARVNLSIAVLMNVHLQSWHADSLWRFHKPTEVFCCFSTHFLACCVYPCFSFFASGKYVNGMECHRPSGWRHWGGLTCGRLRPEDAVDGISGELGGTYNYYNSSQVVHLKISFL